MDNNTHNRDIVFCHQCENEWYRDEHGLICPECQSDFTEIVEADHDPREEEGHIPGDVAPPQHGDFDAPDPDEDDIDNLRWEQTGPDRYRVRGTYRTTIGRDGQPVQQGQGEGQGDAPGGLMGLVGNMIQGALGAYQQGGQQQQGQQQQRQIPDRPASAPGSPPPERGGGGNGTFIRHGHGPGFSYTIASTSHGSIGGGPTLFPRNANMPQPYQNQPDHIEQMLNQMMMNIGAMPGQQPGGGMRMGQPPAGFHNHDDGGGFPAGPFMMGGGGPGFGPFANLFNIFGGPSGAVGDAVYSQEALDRIITQLMEQHQAGNAPPPASEAAIKALPRKQISEADLGEGSGKAECSICMDEVPLGGEVTVLPCQHWFHHECIKAWLTEHDTCPHCRQGIMPKDEQAANQPRSPTQAPLHDMLRSSEYTRPAVPGAYPFPRQNSGGGVGDGSAQNPFQVPDSPTMNRSNSTGGRRSGSTGGGGGVFSRMRDAFSGSGSGSGSGSRG